MSFESQLQESLPALRAFAGRLERSSDRADDLMQLAVEKALAARRSFDGANMKAWLFTIAKNAFVNSRRKEGLRRRKEAQVSHSAAGVWRASHPMAPDAMWSGRDAEKALDSLIPEYREVVLAVAEGLRYKEAAKRAGCPIGTVMSRLHRARAAFAESAA